tara:strand:- start:8 stop:598 length:591 start_codon:yes stop_codon:yes gene_type:complete
MLKLSNKGAQMAIKTMSAATGGNSVFSEGWHETTVRKAEYGIYAAGSDKQKRYLDIWFEDYPDNMNLRVYETFNKETKHEFAIENIFRYANAGIVSKLEDPTGKNPLLQYDDDEKGLINAKINIFVYKETKTGNNYSRIFEKIAPVAQVGEHLTYTEKDVIGMKKSCEKNYDRKVQATAHTQPNSEVQSSDFGMPL